MNNSEKHIIESVVYAITDHQLQTDHGKMAPSRRAIYLCQTMRVTLQRK